MQNTFLEDSVCIPLFRLHPDLHDKRVHQTDKTPIYMRLKIAFEYCDAILGLEETNKTEKLGKWLVLMDTIRKKEAKDSLDTRLPVLFQAVEVEYVSIYAYPHFLYPHCGNHHQQKQAEETAKTLQQLNLTVERVSKSHKRTTQRQQQRKLEVVFESNDQPPAPKKAKTSA